jgi:uncharacterized protein YndB with AHSA1/START domain
MCPDQTAATVERRLGASPTRVFDAFADPAIVGRWLTPSPEVSLTVLQFDFRVGGRYRFAYRVPGRGTMHVNGDFRLIEPPERLAFAWNIEPPDEHAGVQSEVSVTLRPDGEGTHLVIRHAYLAAPGAARRHADGWRGALEHLASLLDDTAPAQYVSAHQGDRP